MRLIELAALASIFAGFNVVALADEARLSFGGDQFAAGQTVSVAGEPVRDAFIAGYDVTLGAPVTGDAHLAGFNVNDSADVAGDVYAMGFSLNLSGAIGGDLTAAGNSISLGAPQPVGGNLRLAAQSVALNSPVSGAALITAQTLTLNSSIAGDLSFYGEAISFGPEAKVAGRVIIQAPKEIAVPGSVAAADRVSFIQLVVPDYASEAGKTAQHAVRGFWPEVWGNVVWWLMLFVLGAALIALAPKRVAALEAAASRGPWRQLGLGVLAFAAMLGLVPVTAMTVIGLVLLPVVLVVVAIACALAYLGGAYLVGLRIGRAFTPLDSNGRKLAILAVALVVAGLLAMVPLLGWLLTLLLLVYGFGAIARMLLGRTSAPVSGQAVAA